MSCSKELIWSFDVSMLVLLKLLNRKQREDYLVEHLRRMKLYSAIHFIVLASAPVL